MKVDFNCVIVEYDNLEKTEKLKKKLLFFVFVFLAFHHIFFSAYTLKTNLIQSITEGLSALIVILGLLTLKYKANIIVATLLLAIYSFLSISIGVWENGGIFSSEIGWYIITIFSLTAALDRSIGILFYIGAFIIVLVMGVLQYFKVHDFAKNILINGENYALFSCFSIFVIIGIILTYVFTTENINRIWKKEKVEKIELLEIERAKQLMQDKINSMNFTKQLLENTEEERKRIASDLHDSISHELLSLKTTFQQDFKTVNAKIDNIINDIRGISRNLHPVMFDKIGLLPNIEQLVERIQAQNDFMVAMELNYHGSLNSANELQIYRIIQEALSNIIKYAKAYAAKITIDEKKDSIFIEIKDNGKGFEVKETLNGNKAFGLHNIIERSRVIGGEAQIQSSEEGTIITINIPKTT